MLGASSRTSRQEFYVNGNAAVPVTLCWLSMAHAIWPICSYVTAIVVQGWIADRRERNVIEPDDAQIVGDSDTESVQRAEQLERAKIIEAQDQIALLLHELARDASEIVARPTPKSVCASSFGSPPRCQLETLRRIHDWPARDSASTRCGAVRGRLGESYRLTGE